jgi:hypothetical protein
MQFLTVKTGCITWTMKIKVTAEEQTDPRIQNFALEQMRKNKWMKNIMHEMNKTNAALGEYIDWLRGEVF